MIASLGADLLKSRKRAANWILVAILVAILIGIVYLVTYAIMSNPPPGFQSNVPASELKRSVFPENLVPTVLNGISTLGAAIMLILGALSTASEYGWGTVQTILVQRPGRLAVLGGKLLALALITVLVTLVVFAACAVVSLLLATLDGAHGQWPSAYLLLRGIGATALILAVWTALGMVLGVVFRSTAAAIGGGLTYLFVVESLLGALFRTTPGVKDVLRFLPGINASAIVTSFPYTYRGENAAVALVGASRGAITLVIYLAVFTLIAVLVFQRRDVGA